MSVDVLGDPVQQFPFDVGPTMVTSGSPPRRRIRVGNDITWYRPEEPGFRSTSTLSASEYGAVLASDLLEYGTYSLA